MSQAAAPFQNLNLDASKPGSALNTGGLNATETGAVDDAVLRFAAAATIVGGGITEVTTADNGTVVTVSRPGWYSVVLLGAQTAATTVAVGISNNVAAAGLNSDPAFTIAGFLEVQDGLVLPAAVNQPIALRTMIDVTKGTAAVIRFHGTNSGGAAPDFSGTLASFAYIINRLGDSRGHS